MYNNASPERPRILPWIFVGLITLLVVGSCSLTTYYSLDRTFSFFESFDPKIIRSNTLKSSDKVIAQLNITGVIMGSREDIFDSLEEIEEGVKEDKVKGLLLFINSPGGSVAPTQDLFARVLELKTKIPVVCSMGDVAASGGYYLAAACDEIYALPGTTTGSIGVIFQFFNLENLVSWAKIKPVTIKAGKMKDVGSPFRELAPEERAYLENLLKEVHEQFIMDIAKIRSEKIPLEKLREVADGRIFTGEQALNLGLVDKSGGPKDAIKWLKEDKKLGDLKIVRLPYPKRNIGGILGKLATESSTPMERIFDQLHPFQGMVPMLLPSHYQFQKSNSEVR
ncbi:MAG: signal peptide peptidase SppA [Bdellovibrionota bacterium]